MPSLEPERANDTVREYAMVVGATCQQAYSQRMADLKNLTGLGDAGISFNTVVVDEARPGQPTGSVHSDVDGRAPRRAGG